MTSIGRPYGRLRWRAADCSKRVLKKRNSVTLKATRCYLTVSYKVLATQYTEVYRRVMELREVGTVIAARKGQNKVESPSQGSGNRKVGRDFRPATYPGCEPLSAQWTDRRRRELTFWLAQVLIEHGCEYLCRINREPTEECHHCTASRDMAQHMLEEYPVWAHERRTLTEKLGGTDSLLPNIVTKMLGSEKTWKKMASFCESIMLQKEAAERVHRGQVRRAEGKPTPARGGGRLRLAEKKRPRQPGSRHQG